MGEHSRRNHGGEGHAPRGERPRFHKQHGSGGQAQRPKPVYEREVVAEGKRFVVRGISNHRGKALEIREYSHGRDNIVVFPHGGVDEILEAIAKGIDALDSAE